jgi:hypothetical protein
MLICQLKNLRTFDLEESYKTDKLIYIVIQRMENKTAEESKITNEHQ